MFFPKNSKFRKSRKLVSKGTEFKATRLRFGSFGLKSLSNGRVTAKNIETGRQAINRKIRPFGKMWIRIFAHTPITSIALKTRMGKGKGNVSYWAANIKKGQILYEISGVSKELAFEALRVGALKLPLKTKIISY